MLIDAHTHILSLAEDAEFTTEYGREGSLCIYYIATVTPEELFRFLVHAEQSFVPLEKLFFGTDYPGFLYDPVELRAKLLSVNHHAERVGSTPIPAAKLDGILGDNYARMSGLLP